jgi:hypothetical protein
MTAPLQRTALQVPTCLVVGCCCEVLCVTRWITLLTLTLYSYIFIYTGTVVVSRLSALDQTCGSGTFPKIYSLEEYGANGI